MNIILRSCFEIIALVIYTTFPAIFTFLIGHVATATLPLPKVKLSRKIHITTSATISKQLLKNSILFFLLLGCSQSSANMETALTTVVENGTAVTLEQITDFEWDKVYVIGPYDQFDYSHISHVPAGVRKVIERQIIEERNALLIFTLDDKYVKLYDISVGPVDKLGMTGGVFSPDTLIPIKD